MFEAVINWVKHSKKEREASLPELLQYVRMPLLTPRYITDVIDTEVPQPLPGVLPAHTAHPELFSLLLLLLVGASVEGREKELCRAEIFYKHVITRVVLS